MPPPAGRDGGGGGGGADRAHAALLDAGAIAPAALRILQRLRAAEMGAAPADRAGGGRAGVHAALMDLHRHDGGGNAAAVALLRDAAPPDACLTDSDADFDADDTGDDDGGAHDAPPSPGRAWPRPPPCVWIAPGARFAGRQRVSRPAAAAAGAGLGDWDVRIVVEEVDWAAGRLAGAMTATAAAAGGAPATTVRTVFTGEIIDNVNHTMLTPSYGVTPRDDARHWARFPGGAGAWRAALRGGGRAAALAGAPFLLMRWKETSFCRDDGSLAPPGATLRAPHRGGGVLSIAGVYYVQLDRASGEVAAFYWDPRSTPFQKLELVPVGGARVEYGFR